ncbi:hypothetical protein AVEN_128575-1 [Araneus ventricosus]|uniref:Uncharacterized protein n=1 Tax=Araneus ventricosus TaxID=182803 RepID=A0A4Y2SAV0_ARAVE|nr:hypothetical protein AVEN_128575-1 [Araneus ventricosus]
MYDLTYNRPNTKRILSGIVFRTWNPPSPKPRPYYWATAAQKSGLRHMIAIMPLCLELKKKLSSKSEIENYTKESTSPPTLYVFSDHLLPLMEVGEEGVISDLVPSFKTVRNCVDRAKITLMLLLK